MPPPIQWGRARGGARRLFTRATASEMGPSPLPLRSEGHPLVPTDTAEMDGSPRGNELPVGNLIRLVARAPKGELDPHPLPWNRVDGGATHTAFDTRGAEAQPQDPVTE